MSRRARSITSAADFSRIYSARQSCVGDMLKLHYAKATSSQPRLGMSISKRLTSTAVQRNLVRRQLAETFRLTTDKLPAVDVVVTLTKECTDKLQARKLASEFKQLLLTIPTPNK